MSDHDLTATNARLVDAAASREHQILRLQDRVNEMEQERIAGVSHAMLRKAFLRDDRDLLVQLRDRLRLALKAGDPWECHRGKGLARELLDMFPDDLL